MRRHSSLKPRAGAFPRALFAAIFGMGLVLAILAQPARAQGVYLWRDAVTSGSWDTTSANWTLYPNGASTTFSNSTAVVFGASGNSAGGYIYIPFVNSDTVAYTTFISPQPYTGPGATTSGTNPGMIIRSGSWEFAGAGFSGGGVAVTGDATMHLDYNATFANQNITVSPNVNFTLTATDGAVINFTNYNNTGFTGSNSAINTGAGSNLNFAYSGTSAATFTFITNSSEGLGAAINAGGNVTMTGTGLTVYFANSHLDNIASGVTTTNTVGESYASAAYITGTLALNNGAQLMGEGGFAAQAMVFDSATLTPNADGNSYQNGTITLAVLDAGGNLITGTSGQITFSNMVLNGYAGSLATANGSEIDLLNNLLVDTSASNLNQLPNVMTISAPLTGAGGLDITGPNTLMLTGTNTYTGQTTVESGTLIGNIPEAGALDVEAGAVYQSTSGTYFTTGYTSTIGTLSGAGLVNMSGSDINIESGNFSSGTIINVGTLNKIGADQTLSIGSGAVNALDVQQGTLVLGFDQTLNVAGTATIESTGSLGVALSNVPALTAKTLVLNNGGNIDVTSFGDLTISSTTQTFTLVSTSDAIPADATLTFQGTPLGALTTNLNNFLDLSQVDSATTIAVSTTLAWTNTAPNSAHGTFDITSGTVVLDVPLSNNNTATAYFGGWDGKTLTKTGDGTLVLGGGTYSYTGNTIIDAGGLAVSSTSIITSPTITVAAPGAALYNTGTVTGQTVNNGGLVYLSTGTIGNVMNNSGTLQFDTPAFDQTGTVSYVYFQTGSISGAGDIYKTGDGTVVLKGANTDTGNVYVTGGTLAAGAAGVFNSAASYTLDNQNSTSPATLDLNGYNQNLKQLTYTENGGILNFGPATQFTSFVSATIGTLTGTAGSGANNIIAMRTDYGANKGDQLVIASQVTGNYTLFISNSDSANPTKTNAVPLVVTPAGTGTNAKFTGSVEDGVNVLTVQQGNGGTIMPNSNIWYLALTSKLTNTADAIFATTSAASLEWLYQLDTLSQRMGELRQEALLAAPSRETTSPLAYTTVTSRGGNLWIRGNAYQMDATDSITGEAYTEDVYGVTVGMDKTYRWQQHQYLFGGFATFNQIDRNFQARGTGNTTDYGIGGYFTYLNDNGWYGDFVLKITGNDNTFDATALDGFTNSGSYTDIIWGVTLEVGRQVRNKKNGWWYEPSAQVAFARIYGSDYTTSNDIGVNVGPGNFEQYRIGVRFGHDFPNSPFKPFIRLAVADLQGTSQTVTVENLSYSPALHGVRGEAGAGFSYVINPKSQIYFDYQYAKSNDYSIPWLFDLGYRRTW